MSDTAARIREAMMSLLERHSMDDITVRMICGEAGISRQTFYNYYYSAEEALDEAWRIDFFRAVEGRDTWRDWTEGFRRTLELLAGRRRAVLHVYRSSRRPELMRIIRKHAKPLVKRGIADCIALKHADVTERDRKFLLDYTMSALTGIVKRFIEGGLKEDPAYLAEMTDAVMRYHIRQSLELLREIRQGVRERGPERGKRE